MAIRPNRTYNDPALGAAFSNLASMFGPPSGSDLAGYATASAKRQEAERLADLYKQAQDPSVSWSVLDRLGAATGQYAPSQSMTAVGLNNDAQRYGYDTQAATSRANNLRDNQTQVAIAMSKPFDPGQVRAGTPAEFMQPLELPAIPEFAAPSKPMTEAEVKGKLIQDARNEGFITTQDAASGYNSQQPLVEVVGPDGKPQFMSRAAAASTAAQPYTSRAPSELAVLQSERDALPAGDPRKEEFNARIQALGRGQQQSAYDRTNDEALAKDNTEIAANANRALADRQTYKTILSAVTNPNVDQGTLASARLSINKALNAFGLDGGDTAPAEMLNALGNQLALKLRDPSSGAGMPGAMSDHDREFLRSMSISLGNTREANTYLAQYYMALQQRAVDMNDLRMQYVQQHGRLDEGWRATVADYLRTSDPTAALRSRIEGMGVTTEPRAAMPTSPSPPSPPSAPVPPGTRRRFNPETGQIE